MYDNIFICRQRALVPREGRKLSPTLLNIAPVIRKGQNIF